MHRFSILFLIVITCQISYSEIPLKGFTLSAYYQDAYYSSEKIIDSILERYENKNIQINILVTMYIDENGSISINEETPVYHSVCKLTKKILDSGNTVGISIYLDPADNQENRWKLTTIDFNQWFKLLTPYISEGVRLICFSPEMEGSEKLSGWTSFIVKFRKNFPDIKIAYNVHHTSSYLRSLNIEPWMTTLDYFGSTLIIDNPSCVIDMVYYEIMSTIQKVHAICDKYSIKPLFMEFGFPSHNFAMTHCSDFNASFIEDQDIQYQLFLKTVSLIENESILFWRIMPAKLQQHSNRDYSWLTYNYNAQVLTAKSSAQIIDKILGYSELQSEIDYDFVSTDVFKINNNSLILKKPIGTIKDDTNRYNSNAITYALNHSSYTFNLTSALKIIDIKLGGFSWSSDDSKFDLGNIIFRFLKDGKLINEKTVYLDYNHLDQHSFSISIENSENISLEISILPSDFAVVLSYLIINF